MESVNELQRDFRKGIFKMLGILNPYLTDNLIKSIYQQIQNRRHHISFDISQGIQDQYPQIFSQILELKIPGFDLQINKGIESCDSKIISNIKCLLPTEYDDSRQSIEETKRRNHFILIFTDDPTNSSKLRQTYRKEPDVQIIDIQENFGSWLVTQDFFLKRIFSDAEGFLNTKIDVVLKVLSRKSSINEGKQILNKSQEINISKDRAKKIQKKLLQVKNHISTQIRKEFTQIDQEVGERLNPDSESIRKLFNEISAYRGFNEQDDSRNTSYSIPEEYVESVKQKLRTIYTDQIAFINDRSDQANRSILNSLSDLEEIGNRETPFEVKKQFPNETIQKTIDREEVTIKKYEKAVPKKGIYQLLMELRTPLYIIFPLFIIARFINTSDEGAIDKNVSSLSGEPVVVITQLPESYNKNEQKFIAALNKQMNNGELVNQSTGEEIFKYRLDNRRQRKQVIYYLIPSKEEGSDIAIPIESDRSLAVELLENGLLKISKRFNVISELQKIPLIFGPFKSLFGPVVLILIVWFIKSRRDRMRHERESIRRREEQSLLNDLKKDINRLTNSIETVCSNQIKIFARGVSDELSYGVEKWMNNRLKKEEFLSARSLKLIKERNQYFQNSIKELTQSKKMINEVTRELSNSLRK